MRSNQCASYLRSACVNDVDGKFGVLKFQISHLPSGGTYLLSFGRQVPYTSIIQQQPNTRPETAHGPYLFGQPFA
jgi:hypothetical protein